METGMRAMVVDDSRTMRLILGKTLGDLGYSVSQAANGREALDMLERDPEPVGLVLVDWNMPELNGIEFVRRMRSMPRFQNVRLVMVTTETQAEQMMAALEAGADEYIMKPFTSEVIVEKLKMLGLAA